MTLPTKHYWYHERSINHQYTRNKVKCYDHTLLKNNIYDSQTPLSKTSSVVYHILAVYFVFRNSAERVKSKEAMLLTFLNDQTAFDVVSDELLLTKLYLISSFAIGQGIRQGRVRVRTATTFMLTIVWTDTETERDTNLSHSKKVISSHLRGWC